MYICGSCSREIELGTDELVRCPFCGHKILYKERPKVGRRVKVK